MARKEIAVDGIPYHFKKGQSGNPNGRPKNKFKHLRDQFELSTNDVQAVIEHILSMSKAELKAVIKNPDSTMLEISFASAVIKSIQKGRMDAVDSMLNRKIGKPKESVEVTGAEGKSLFPSPKEIIESMQKAVKDADSGK